MFIFKTATVHYGKGMINNVTNMYIAIPKFYSLFYFKSGRGEITTDTVSGEEIEVDSIYQTSHYVNYAKGDIR